MIRSVLRSEPSPAGDRRYSTRWWTLTLECGHEVRRPVRYERDMPFGAQRRHRPRAAADVLPAQTRAYCDRCPTPPAHEVTRIRVRASPARAASLVEALRTVAPDLVVAGPRFRAAGFVDYYCETAINLEGAERAER